MLICFEGMDGVGKSSVVRKVATELGIQVVEKPINRLLNFTKEQSDLIVEKIYSKYSTKLHSMYYLTGFLSVLEESKSTDIIMDRGILSTYYFSHTEESDFIFNVFIQNDLYPDLNIILYASADERIRRILNRNEDDVDLKKTRIYNNGYEKYFEAIKKYNMNYLLVNTNKLTEEATVSICKKIIDMYRQGNLDIIKAQDLFSIENKEKQAYLDFNELSSFLEKCTLKGTKVYKIEK